MQQSDKVNRLENRAEFCMVSACLSVPFVVILLNMIHQVSAPVCLLVPRRILKPSHQEPGAHSTRPAPVSVPLYDRHFYAVAIGYYALCDNNPPTLQTDRWTSCLLAYIVAYRAENTVTTIISHPYPVTVCTAGNFYPFDLSSCIATCL